MTEPLVLMCCCPACATLFEVADMQLEQHAGLVRCGECERVFNATWHLVDEPDSVSPQPIVRTEISPLNQDIDEAALTAITTTLADEPLAEPPKRFLEAATSSTLGSEAAWVIKVGETREF